MLENFSTNATVAKIRTMSGSLLKKEDYNNLLSKHSVTEIAVYLKSNTRYSDILANIETSSVHRGFLEALIRKKNFETYIKLCKFQNLDKNTFYNFKISIEEIHLILNYIIHLNSGTSENFISKVPSYLIENSELDIQSLVKAKNLDEIIKAVQHSPYYKDLKNVKSNSDKIDLPKCEQSLRTGFYTRLLETIDKQFDNITSEQLKKSILTQISLVNVIDAYRLKAFFNASSQEIKNRILPFYNSMSKNLLLSIYNSKDKDEMIEKFKSSKYAMNISDFDTEYAEHSVFRIRYNTAKSDLINAQHAPVALYSFDYLCDVEIMNLIYIIEGIRYNTSPSYIETLLIM